MKRVAFAKIISLSKETMLLGFRSSKCNNPQTWNYFGGNIKKGETPIDTVCRELGEEITNIYELRPVQKIANCRISVYHFKKKICYLFTIFVSNEFSPILNWEHSDFMWLKMGDFERRQHGCLLWPILHPMVKKIQQRDFEWDKQKQLQYKVNNELVIIKTITNNMSDIQNPNRSIRALVKGKGWTPLDKIRWGDKVKICYLHFPNGVMNPSVSHYKWSLAESQITELN